MSNDMVARDESSERELRAVFAPSSIPWIGGVQIKGVSALLSKIRELLITTRLLTTKSGQIRPNQAQLGIAMPRNKVSNDIDHIRKDPQPEKAPKEPPPKLKPLPKYKPIQIKKPFTHGHRLLPDTIPNNPYTIFSLFLTKSILATLIQYINKYAFLYSRLKTPYSRT